MARSLVSIIFVAATAAGILLGAGTTPVSAQKPPSSDVSSTPEPGQKKYPEVEQAVQTLFGHAMGGATAGSITIAGSAGAQTFPDHDMAAAIKLLEVAAQKYPELPTAHVMMYQILSQLNQPAAARHQLELAVQSTPNDPEAHIILGDIAVQEQRLPRATLEFEMARQLLAVYTNVVRKSAIEQRTLSGLAAMAEAREKWDEAESLLQVLLKAASPDEPNLATRQRLARAMFQQGKAKDAYETLKEAKKLDKANAAKNHTREVFLTPEAVMAQYYDQFEGSGGTNAQVWYEAAVRKAPNDLPTRRAVAVWALNKGMIPLAKEQAENALRIEAGETGGLPPKGQKNSGSNVGHTLRGLVALWEKDWAVAEENFQNVLLASPTDFGARNNLALALVEQNDPAKKNKALIYAETNYKDNKKSPDALSTLGWIRFRRGEFDLALLAIEEAIKAAGGLKDPDTATYYAHLLYHQGKEWQTKELVENVLKSDRPFSMRPEAKELYEKVKDAKKPEAAPAAKKP